VRKTVLVRGPVLTQSGYGEHTRFVLRALRAQEDQLDIHILPTGWGETGWLAVNDEERQWIDKRINVATQHLRQKLPYDISVQVTIPNEWQKLAAVNIGVTAGIEANKVSPVWLQQANIMDKVVTISEHSKSGFDIVYSGQIAETGQQVQLGCTVPVEVCHYPVKIFDSLPELQLNLDYDFNYLAVAQWGPRKNLANIIRWFVEENHDQEVGLIVKTSLKNGSVVDREHVITQINNFIPEIPDRKCKVYLLHGDMSEREMHSLYNHSKVKVMVSLTHGEGFGLPLFEAAYSGLPIIAPGWSGQNDFLYMPFDSKAKKNGKKRKAGFAEVEFTMGPVPESALWQGVIEKDMAWCYPTEGSYKLRLRQVRNSYDKWLKKAKKLQEWVCKEFAWDKKHEQLAKHIHEKKNYDYIFVSDMFLDQYTGGAELSLQTLIDSIPEKENVEYLKINSANVTEQMVRAYHDKKWIFGNIAQLDSNILSTVSKTIQDYYFVEYDYKYCEYRNPVLYQFLEDEECSYADTDRGLAITEFINSSKKTFFMSNRQKNIYLSDLPSIEESRLCVLSSTFDEEFFENIESLSRKTEDRTETWLVLGSRSWIKGSSQSEQWCKDNNLEYEVISGLEPSQVLEKMSTAKGVCFLPTGYDTCPRFVIEAKLLGCKLELNDYVQHADEDWFNTDDLGSMKEYLKSRVSFFWSEVA
tara:strand:+ start:838 stop:2925 length:2088 start_codon:yes stop_codon:yes gene_type:complete